MIKRDNNKSSFDRSDKVFMLASALGCPESMITRNSKITWNIAPGDDTLYSEIEFTKDGVSAAIWLNYLNKPIKVIGLGCDGKQDWVSGVLKNKSSGDHDASVLDAVQTFKSHLNSMASGPFMNSTVSFSEDAIYAQGVQDEARAA